MSPTQKQSKSTSFDGSRAVPQRVGKHRPVQCVEPEPSKAKAKAKARVKTVLQVLSTIVLTFIAMNGLVFLGAYTPFGTPA